MSKINGRAEVLRCRRCMHAVYWSIVIRAYVRDDIDPLCGKHYDGKTRPHVVAPTMLSPDNVRRFLDKIELHG